jgi:bacterioferritin-associated ferredoxin
MMNGENVIVCRCSDVTLKELRDLIAEGYHTFEEIKRITRIGMGPCQGKTCGQIVLRELSIATGKPITELKFQTNRPPIVGVKLNLIAEEARNDD